MDSGTAIAAARKRKCLALVYDGFARLVEVHEVGQTSGNAAAMLVWQVDGGSRSRESTGWKLLHLEDVTDAVLSDIPSQAPRPDYNLAGTKLRKVTFHV